MAIRQLLLKAENAAGDNRSQYGIYRRWQHRGQSLLGRSIATLDLGPVTVTGRRFLRHVVPLHGRSIAPHSIWDPALSSPVGVSFGIRRPC
jgi:hypothetical protein